MEERRTMATIYIVEDDVNIREIERYALKNSGLKRTQVLMDS